MASLRAHLESKERDAPSPGPNGAFAETTFVAVIKGASHLSSGNMRAMIEIPYGETDAFLTTRKAFEIELVFTVRRKVTQAD